MAAKRLELLRELVPAATRVALLINPAAAADTESMLRDVESATSTMGLQLQIVKANTIREIDTAFATFLRERPDVLFVSGGPFLLSRRVQLALLAARYSVPASYGSREYAENGGLIAFSSAADNDECFAQDRSHCATGGHAALQKIQYFNQLAAAAPTRLLYSF